MVIVSLLFGGVTAHAKLSPECGPAMEYIFPFIDFQTPVVNLDIDDTILRLNTAIVLMHKNSEETKVISSNEFNDIRATLGLPGPNQDLEFRGQGPTGSFRHFYYDAGRNFFKEDVLVAAQPGTIDWQGPMWKAFEHAMEDPMRARHTFLVTARGHRPEDIFEGLLVLQGLGYIKNVPPVENIFPVMHHFPDAPWDKVPALKVSVLLAQLTFVDSHTETAGRRSWTFSDDDPDNIHAVMEAISEGKREGRWNNVQPFVFYTGHKPWEGPRSLAVDLGGAWRALNDSEASNLASYL